MKTLLKLMAIFTILLVSFPTIALAENTSDTQNIQQIRERVLSIEKKANVLERIMVKINSAIQTQTQTQTQIQNPVSDEFEQLRVKSIQKNEIQTMNNIKLIPASKQVTLKIENGKAYAMKANISKEIKAEPSVLIANKIPYADLDIASNFRVEADIQNNELEYNVTYEVPNPVPIFNWIFPTINKEVKVTAEEIKQADAKITETAVSKTIASAISAVPAPIQYN